MDQNGEIEKFLEDLSDKVGDGLSSPAVVLWRMMQLEAQARHQKLTARCPRCAYVVPDTMMTMDAGPGKKFCTICEEEFDYQHAFEEAQKYAQFENEINAQLAAAGFNGRIYDLKKSVDKGLMFKYDKEFLIELRGRRERFTAIFKEVIPEAYRK